MKHGTIEHIEHLTQAVLGDLETLEDRTRLQGDHVLSQIRSQTQELLFSIRKHPDYTPPVETTELLVRSCNNCAIEAHLLFNLKQHNFLDVSEEILMKCLPCTLSPLAVPGKSDNWVHVGNT